MPAHGVLHGLLANAVLIHCAHTLTPLCMPFCYTTIGKKKKTRKRTNAVKRKMAATKSKEGGMMTDDDMVSLKPRKNNNNANAFMKNPNQRHRFERKQLRAEIAALTKSR